MSSDDAIKAILFIILAFFGFILIVLAIIFVLTFFIAMLKPFVSGWRQLAKIYPFREISIGEEFYSIHGITGQVFFPVEYVRTLNILISSSGLSMESTARFSFMTPKLFIPWENIDSVSKTRHFFRLAFRIRVQNSWVTIFILGDAGKAILEAWTASRSGLEINKASPHVRRWGQ